MVEYGGSLWMIGGLDSDFTFRNDVWSSGDGANWTEITPAAAFPGRFAGAMTVFDNKMWMVGGLSSGGPIADVWSSTDGLVWTPELDAGPFPGNGHAVVSHDGAMWVVGGANQNEVWTSSNGVDWSAVAPSPTPGALFPGRSGHKVIVKDGTMWLIGGAAGGNQFNDVWSSQDGASWIEETAAAAFSPRDYLGAATHEGRLFVVGGFTGAAEGDTRVWSSEDGATWRSAHRTVITF